MLTKSDFLKFIQCPKYLWLHKNRKDLLPEDVDANLQRIFDEGYHVESYAMKLYPGGIDAEVEGHQESIAKTKDLIADGIKTIFQPTFVAGGMYCRSDIIKYDDETKAWDIHEVKSSTRVKDINLHDVAFQKICLEDAGLKVGKLYLVMVNTKYVRKGEVEPDKLVYTEDVTDVVHAMIDNTRKQIENALAAMKEKDEPVVRILKQCRKPYECTFLDHCWKDIPKKSIYDISGGLTEAKLNMLIDEGVMLLKDIPDGVITSKAGMRQERAEKRNELHIEKENIAEDLEQLEYPLYFLDYETFAPGVPLFDNYRPYQRITFQYSLHVQEVPSGEVKHYAYLGRAWEDPSQKLAADLREKIGDKGSVIAWNMSFEKGCNREMGERYPEFAEYFAGVNDRMYDLMNVFRKGYYVHKDFHGSASIKKVLPVLVPELSYSDLDIHEGATASNKWRDLIDPDTDKKEADKIYDDLLKYCKLDTLAMVKILEELEKLDK